MLVRGLHGWQGTTHAHWFMCKGSEKKMVGIWTEGIRYFRHLEKLARVPCTGSLQH